MFKNKKIVKLIKRFNFTFPSLTTKKIILKDGFKTYKKIGKKNIFSKVYTQKLLAKQQLKLIYGINEYQLKKCINFSFALDRKNHKGILLNIYNLLERHLYFILFKYGIVKTINQAKQMISHKQILVNYNICPFTYKICHVGDIISSKYSLFNPFEIRKDETSIPSYKTKFLISKALEFFK